MEERLGAENSYFYLRIEKNDVNRHLVDEVDSWSRNNNVQAYIIDKPLGDSKYTYSHRGAFAILIPKMRIIFVDFSGDEGSFEDYVDDFVEDIGSISDKFRYKDVIGRPRKWKDDLVVQVSDGRNVSFEDIFHRATIGDPAKQRVSELILSLLTGSINDIERVGADVPDNLLEKVKRNIVLYDGDQTRFVYEKPAKSPVWIQGLSGTGKTELLLHKLKEIYTEHPESRIIMTCHNKILAETLRSRIPDFFNFMKVEQQIRWNERLWCVHAWGSGGDADSGAYRRICAHYGIPFLRWSRSTNFDYVCKQAIKEIEEKTNCGHAFDYMLIDESQDFPDSFFELCARVTRDHVYVAGDIFQSIFDTEIISRIEPDFLLSKCYRTDPHTLMFAHSLGMGLFEEKKRRWLEDAEWRACGYIIDRDDDSGAYQLSREPLRRFSDVDEHFQSTSVWPTEGDFRTSSVEAVVSIIREISNDNPTLTPDDVGIILMDYGNLTYAIADTLEQVVPRELGWSVNKAYETKRKTRGEVFVSNRNNVKGLEFPFVICVTRSVTDGYGYRNALYMTLTRSFIKSYVVMDGASNKAVLPRILDGLKVIEEDGYISVVPPSEEEKKDIMTSIKYRARGRSYYDMAHDIFKEMDVAPLFEDPLYEMLKAAVPMEDFDYDQMKEMAEKLHDALASGRGRR